jgi:hypothetical protein
VIRNVINRMSATTRASRLCAGPGGRLDRINRCSSGAAAAVFIPDRGFATEGCGQTVHIFTGRPKLDRDFGHLQANVAINFAAQAP